MEYAVPTADAPLHGVVPVPPSKSMHQRVLVLERLAATPVRIDVPAGTPAAGEDVQRLSAALAQLGRWRDGTLGDGRDSLRLDFGMGATGLRFCMPLAALRPAGARTLLRGAPALMRRPHGTLRRALVAMGARIKRRHSGALRVLGGGLHGTTLRVDPARSSQYASALLLAAPRCGGLTLELTGRPASLPYLRLTLRVLAAFGVRVAAEGLTTESARIVVEAGAPHCESVRLEPDASCAAAWWSAAALSGGSLLVPGIRRSSGQADMALLPLLERMGARVEDTAAGVRVSGGGLEALGEVDLCDSPDLIFLVGALAARAHGETVIRGVTHTRRKESDRVAVLARGLTAMGARVALSANDTVRIQGGLLHGAAVSVAGDHRAAFAFGVLGLGTPGVVLCGPQAANKSHPSFLQDLGALAHEASYGKPPRHG